MKFISLTILPPSNTQMHIQDLAENLTVLTSEVLSWKNSIIGIEIG